MKNTQTHDNHPYVYCFIRRDLSQPQQVVQVAHATIESCKSFDYRSLPEHPSVIVCGVKTETQLETVMKRLKEQGIRFALFREPDIGNQLTAIATEPICDADRGFFRKFQLLKGDC